MAGKTSKKSAKGAKKAPPKPVRPSQCTSSQAAILRSRRPLATLPCKPTSRPCPAGKRISGSASTRSSWPPSPMFSRPSSGTRRLRHRGPGLVPRHPLLHEVHQGGFLPRHVAASRPPRRVQAKGSALPRHPRGRPARRSSIRRLGEASQPITWRTNVRGQCEVQSDEHLQATRCITGMGADPLEC